MRSVADAHVLYIPAPYEDHDPPVHESVFREQIAAASMLGVKTGLVSPELNPARGQHPANWLARRFQIVEGDEDGVSEMKVAGWSIPRFPRLTRSLWLVQAQRLIKHYVRRRGAPDLIHAHCVHPAGIAALAAKQNWRIPYVVTEHFAGYTRGAMSDEMMLQARDVFTRADRIVTVGRTPAKDIKSYVGGQDVHIIPHLVDTEFFTPPPERRPASPFRFLFAGILNEDERVDDVLKAFAAAFRSNGDVRLEIGGDGGHRPHLEALSAQLGVSGQVVFSGALDRERVRDAMRRASALVCASGVETHSVVLIEAMSTGLPVIAARGEGSDEYVNDEVGRLIAPGDIEAMQKSMLEMVSFHHDWSRAGPAIRSYVEENFSARVVGPRLIETYNSVIQRP
jgi:glycosyltransferase involved in cell wall biosynthesis